MTAIRLLPLALLIAASYIARAADSWKAPELAMPDDVHLTGLWGGAQARNAARLAMAPLDKADFILADLSLKQQRRYTEYSGDISGRWIGAAAFLAPRYPKAFAAFPAIVAEIPTYQKADGHFGVEQDLPHIELGRDTAILWGNGRLLIGLVEVYERTGDPKALETAKKLGDYFITTDPVYNKPDNIVRKPGGTYHDSFETYYLSCIEGLAALGHVTDDHRYLDEGKRIAELALSVTNFDSLHTHGRLCAMRGIADLYAVTGDPHWREGAERDWKIFMERYRLPTGGVKEVLEPNCNSDEGCAESDWLRLNLSLWRLTGKGRYLDEAERCLKGHFIANQFSNGGAGHRILHQIDGQPVAFTGQGEEAWWCCSEHWARATADIARFAVTSGQEGPWINLMIDCEGVLAGPGGKWKFALRETAAGLKIALESPASTNATVRIHRPAWAQEGARIEKPESLSLRETKDAWFVEGLWTGTQEIVVHLPTSLRSEAAPADAGVLLRGHDLLVAHRVPANAWLIDAMPKARPVVLWSAAMPVEDGRVIGPASLKADADPNQPADWKKLELAPLRALTGQPHEAAWFSFQLRSADKAAVFSDQQCKPFLLEALVDFPDDVLQSPVPVTPKHVDAMMQRLKELGVRRVSWAYYGDGHGGYEVPTACQDERWKNLELTYRQLGNPLKVAVEAGHRHGLEVYAYYKPYETGPAVVIPEGSPEAKQNGRIPQQGGSLGWVDPFVVRHPELRLQHCAEGVVEDAARPPVRAIRLTKCNAAPTRITKDHLEIWTSPNNYRYRRAKVKFNFSESVEKSPREVCDQDGRMMTRKGDPVRILTLSGLNIRTKYVLVTTDFQDGPGDFSNAGTALLTALDERGQAIPGVFATGGSIWLANMVDFRNGGLMFDHGRGAIPVTLDEPNASGRTGFIAFTASRNKHLPGALCETEPQVQEFWLSCLEEMIAAGVDGVDFREENHSTMVDFPEEYGFNPVVLERCKELSDALLENVAQVRGEAYTDFLRKCKQRLSARGKRMRYNLQLDYFRPDPPACRLLAYPANIHFDWRRWLDEGLMDEAVLRFYHFPFSAVFDDKIAQEMVVACRRRGIPISVNRYTYTSEAENLPTEIQRVKQDGRFAGFIFYETAVFLKLDASGGCTLSNPVVHEAANRTRD